MFKKLNNLLILVAVLVLPSCLNDDDYVPKPKGYFYIQLPEKSYKNLNLDCPFNFEIPQYAKIEKTNDSMPCWFNLVFPKFKATIYFSYKPINNNFDTLIEDSRTLAYKHTIKAVDIEQKLFNFPERNVSGLCYHIKGNTASNLQFHVTDSLHHFLRGSLYFASLPNQDSLKPVLDFIKQDIEHIYNTIKWE